MGAVVCGGWKGHSHTWEVVGIVASWGMVEGEAAFLVRVSSRSLYISHTSTPSKTTTTTRWMNTYR